MELVLRAVAIYFFFLLLFRISGQRSMAQITTFDFVLLLLVAEATQQALTGEDHSFTAAALVVMTLAGIDIGLSLLKQASPRLDRLLEGTPLILVENGRPLRDRMRAARIDEQDVLAAARERHGLERMEQIKFAVLERSGGISIVPAR
jgi:uncharacterized membrane protein YcaP (DUF421 family)